MQQQGAEYPQIWHLFAYLPSATDHLARFTQEILRGPSPLSPGLRELIAAYTSTPQRLSVLNQLPRRSCGGTCWVTSALVRGVLADVESSSLDDRHKALFRFIDKINHDSPRIGPADLEAVRAAGWTDEAIYFAITVCALFNFYNRWIDATGVHALSDEAHRPGGKRMAAQGYARS